MKVYKVKDMQTGLFSSGGYRPSWSKRGKVWTTFGAVRRHIRNIRNDRTFLLVVEYDLVQVSEVPANSMTKENLSPLSK